MYQRWNHTVLLLLLLPLIAVWNSSRFTSRVRTVMGLPIINPRNHKSRIVMSSSRHGFLSSFLGSSLISIGILYPAAGSWSDASAAASSSSSDDMDGMSSGIPSPAAAVYTPTNPRYIDSELQMQYANVNGNPRYRGILVRRFTGDSTPYTFPVRPIRLVKSWPKEKAPFTPEDFYRADQQDDGSFYAVPRFVYHIDEPAVSALVQYYRTHIPPQSSILDICSSWVSHYPLEFPKLMKRISGTGMNELELRANDQLTDFFPRNLNLNPKLPYPDESFDIVTCVVSIDYLIHPIEVLKEAHRVLRKGGKVIISQSNRCFPSKAIAMWLRMNDRQHLELINSYFQYAGGFKERIAYDITAEGPGQNGFDPMFIIEAEKM